MGVATEKILRCRAWVVAVLDREDLMQVIGPPEGPRPNPGLVREGDIDQGDIAKCSVDRYIELRAVFEGESARYPWVVAAAGADVVGFARASPWKSRGAYAWTVEMGVYVCAAARGAGVGRALYDALVPMLREAGFHTALAGIALPNDASVRLHESIGMRAAGVLPSVGYKLGAWRDVGYWAMRLAEGAPPGAH